MKAFTSEDTFALRHEAGATGYEPVDTETSCVLTRFEVRSLWALLRCYLSFRRIRADARQINGLLITVFLVENFRTCYTLSIWRDVDAILQFNTETHSHIHAANRSFRLLRFRQKHPELWSAQLRFSALSPYNLRWEALEAAAGLDQPIVREHRRHG